MRAYAVDATQRVSTEKLQVLQHHSRTTLPSSNPATLFKDAKTFLFSGCNSPVDKLALTDKEAILPELTGSLEFGLLVVPEVGRIKELLEMGVLQTLFKNGFLTKARNSTNSES